MPERSRLLESGHCYIHGRRGSLHKGVQILCGWDCEDASELNAEEPKELADAILKMGLSHAVITVVNRDDLSDGGAMHYRDCI